MEEFWRKEHSEPIPWVSVLMPCYNTKATHLVECLQSIAGQNGNFGIELVVINDGSSQLFTTILEKAIEHFSKDKKNFKIVYLKFYDNKGVSYSLNRGVLLCSNELVIRMDSDDIMHDTRINIQIEFMKNNPECVICGTDMFCFHDDENQNNKAKVPYTSGCHPEYLYWEDYIKEEQKKRWILNHPTVCFRKSAVLEVGNYNTNIVCFEDLDLYLRLLKKYGCIRNIKEKLLMYRSHTNNITKVLHDNDRVNVIQKHIQELIASE